MAGKPARQGPRRDYHIAGVSLPERYASSIGSAAREKVIKPGWNQALPKRVVPGKSGTTAATLHLQVTGDGAGKASCPAGARPANYYSSQRPASRRISTS